MSDTNRWGLTDEMFQDPSSRWGLTDEMFSVPGLDPRSRNLNDLMNDPLFRDLYQAQREFSAVIGSAETVQDLLVPNRNAELGNLIQELTDELSIKYGVTPAEIGNLFLDRTDPLGEFAGTSLRGVTDLLEPLQVPQQIFFRGLSAQLESAQRGDTFVETLQNMAGSLGEVEYGKAFSPGLQEDIITYGDILRQVGISNNTAVRTFGFLGDLLADPLLAGSYTRGLGILARGAGATQAGEGLITIGNRVERALSPMGAVDVTRAVGRGVLGPRAMYSIDRAMARGLQGFLDFPLLGNRTVADVFLPRDMRVVSGFDRRIVDETRRVAETEVFPASMSRATASVDDVIDRINQNVGLVEQIVGTKRTRNVFSRMFDALTNRRTAYDRLFDLPDEMREVVESLATEAADNTSPLAIDDVLTSLEEVTVRNIPGARTVLFRGADQPLATVGGELREIAGAMPPLNRDLYDQNALRVRETAAELGLNADEAEAAYRYVTNRLIESDVLIGWHRTLYEPMKEAFYENTFRLGLGDVQAQQLWEEAIRMGGEGLTPVRAGVDPNPRRFNLAVRKMTEPGPVGEKARRYLLRFVYEQWNGQGLDLTDWFQGLSEGHLRRAYALNDTDWNRYVTAVGSGSSVVPNRLIDDVLYSDALSQDVSSETMDLISQYVEQITPTIPENRGFMVRGDNLIQHLLRNGVNASEARQAFDRMMELLQPERRGIIRRLRDIMARREGVAGSRATGPTSGAIFSSERNIPFGQEVLEQRIQELGSDIAILAEDFEKLMPSSVQGVPSVYLNQGDFVGFLIGEGFQEREALGIVRQLNQVGDWDANAMAEMGRYLETSIPILESARAMKAKYPVARFVADVFNFSSENNLLYKYGDPNVPDDFVLLSGDMYGPLANNYVPVWVKNQVDNAMRLPSVGPQGQGANFLYTLNRIRSVVTANWLASMPTTNTNVIGGIVSAGLAGENPVTFAFDTARVLRDAQRAGGIRNLPEYAEIGDLFGGGALGNQLSRNLRSSRLESLGERGNWTDAVDAISDGLMNLARRPLFGRAGGLFGLEAFQLTEDAMKMATYRRAIASGQPFNEAYQAAKNVVFDYSALPYSLEFLKNTGLILFPGFLTFMTGRVFDAAMRRPGVLGAYDRVGNAIWNAAIPSEEIKAGVSASMSDWEREGNYVPVTIDLERNQFGMLPLQGLIPTRPWAGNPLMQNIQDLGIYQGLFDVVRAFGNQGEATLGSRFGERVFEARSEGVDRFTQIAQFLFNSYGPAYITRAIRFPAGTGENVSGLVPEFAEALRRMVRPLTPGSQEELMQYYEQEQSGETSRGLFDTVISGVLRGVRPVSLDPLLNPVIQNATQDNYEQRQIDIEINRAISRIYSNPNLDATEKLERARALIMEQLEGDIEQLRKYEQVLQAIRTLDDLKDLRNR